MGTITTTSINELTLKALLLDTLTFIKTGHHLHPAYKSAKRSFCESKGIAQNTPAEAMLGHIGQVYKDNQKLDVFNATIVKYGYNPAE